ncbi:MAG: hypothetical protein JXL84_16400 [Deltaproteobacteria bacterium]|nr:hypothetical protein [Deltaproteobacteria bacterium]
MMRRNSGQRGAGVLVPLCLLWIGLIGFSRDVQAGSWLIDPKTFHASVHGRASCQDCHEAIREKVLHPHPDDMTRKRMASFDAEQCLACHDDVQEKLERNLHGSKQVGEPEKYRNCLSCHDPHEQAPIRETLTFDPSRPRQEQCGVCHTEQKTLPPLSPEDDACMTCHGAIGPHDPEGTVKIQGTCFHCHGGAETESQTITAAMVSPINRYDYASTPHVGLRCVVCHPGATEFGHGDQSARPCLSCHPRHDEKVSHDAHLGVACEACHLKGVNVFRDARSGVVRWKRGTYPGSTSQVHHMVSRYDEGDCSRCHRRENRVGAASMILPAKGILCMPCHAATFSVGDPTTVLSLIVFLAGMLSFLAYVLTGTMHARSGGGALGKLSFLVWDGIGSVFSRKALPIFRAVVLDVFLQRRLYRRSPGRWAIHGLIFYPFLFRFLWGLVGLLGSLWIPESEGIWTMLDKNDPLTGFLFDVTGIMLIVGVGLALGRGMGKGHDPLSGVPGQDRLALGLIASIVLVGFTLEGMRIAMTGYPPGSGYSFLGYAVATLFGGPSSGLTDAYGMVWYVHAVLTGLFIAYLPFSRLLHIILAPVVLAMNTASQEGHRA